MRRPRRFASGFADFRRNLVGGVLTEIVDDDPRPLARKIQRVLLAEAPPAPVTIATRPPRDITGIPLTIQRGTVAFYLLTLKLANVWPVRNKSSAAP